LKNPWPLLVDVNEIKRENEKQNKTTNMYFQNLSIEDRGGCTVAARNHLPLVMTLALTRDCTSTVL
jgi:hypothetical protein